jgi:2-aminoethylphosphonate-pyruvate transaminase
MVLLNPGPVNVSERVRRALLGPDLCHRERDFGDLLTRVRQKLLAFAGVPASDYGAVCFTGSGTAAMEAATISAVSPGRKLLVLSNGVYGERIAQIAEIAGIPTTVLRSPWTMRPDLAAADAELARDASIEVVACIHHETTTGLINPMREVGALCRNHGRTLLVDSVSGLGGEALDCVRDGVGIVIGTANKCLQGQPGVSFVLATRRELDRMSGIKPRSLYLDLARTFARQERGEVTFTPAVQIFYALEAALDEVLEEGVANRIARYAQRALELRTGFARLGLESLLPKEFLSNTITTLLQPAHVSYDFLHDELKRAGFIIYAGLGGLDRDVFRVANMGEITAADTARFLAELERLLAASTSAPSRTEAQEGRRS